MSGNIYEIHIDTCAQLGTKTIAAVEALKKLYDVTGMAELRYIETEQGLREKAHRSNACALNAISSDLALHAEFLKRNRDWVEIVPTRHCKAFERQLREKIIPSVTMPVVDAIEQVLPGIRQAVRDNLRRTGERAPEKISLPFIPSKDRLGHNLGRKINDGLVSNAIDSQMKSWQKIVKSNPILKYVPGAHRKGTLMSLIRAQQESLAIAFELALMCEPETMKECGYTESPLGIDHDEPLNIGYIKDHAHEYPPLSLKEPPFSQLQRTEIMEQALRLTDLWPWHFKKALENTAYGKWMRGAHHNRADYAALDYFFNHFAKKSDVDERAFLLITHDAPLIDDFDKFRDGVETKKDPHSEEKTKHPVTNLEYERRGLRKPSPATFPYGEALTSGGLANFMGQELLRAKKYKESPGVAQAMDALCATLEDLRRSSRRDRENHPQMAGLTDKQYVGALEEEPRHGKRRA